MKKEPILYVVVPCYNEEPVLEETTKRLKLKLEKLIKGKEISAKSKVMYVNDGSKDKTWELIQKIHEKEKLFTGLTLSRNRGHQNALLGGLMTAKNYADIVISMDADLQDDINAIDEMVKKYKEGNDIVYGVRSARKKDSFFKRITAEGFYKFMKVLGVDCVYNHADYRLTSKRVLEEFSNFKEVNLLVEKIKSNFVLNNILSILWENKKLNLIIYNKKLQNKISLTIEDYKNLSQRYKVAEKNGKGKEYLINTNIIIFEGEYKNGKKNGKGKEFYDEDGKLKFEGEYLNGKIISGTKYDNYGNIIMKLENGKGKEYYLKENI